MKHTLLLTALLALSAAPALGQNSTTAGAIELYPTFNAIGARVSYSGDDDNDASAYLEWRPQGAPSWTRGVALTRITNLRFAGSVMWLDQDRAYEVRAVISDPDGGGGAPVATARTRVSPPQSPTGRTWWVATHGNDANAGSSSAPFATVRKAESVAQAGDQVRVRPGIYHQDFETSRSGTAAAPIHLLADGPGVVLDGSDPAYLRRSDWRSDGGGVHSIPYAAGVRLVVADSTQRLYHHASLSALQAGADGIAQGWALENGRLHVRLEDGSSPNNHVMHLARYLVGMYVDNSHWRIDGFEVRYFGNAAGASGIYLRGANGCQVTNNYVHSIGGKLILIRVLSSENLVERNMLRDHRISRWPWNAVKSHDEEDAGISNRGGRGNVIRFNTVSGTFNGINCADGSSDENVAADADIHENTITDIGDDALETDTVSGINLRIWRNRIDDVFNGISIAPNYQGPEYVVYNTMSRFRRSAFKYSYASSGQTYLYHNTVWTPVAGAPALWPTGQYSNQHFRNNLIVTNGAAVVSDDGGESQSGNDFDHDLLMTTGATLFRWKGVNYATLSALRSATGFETAGLTGDPLFAGATGGNFSLQQGSPAIDAGLRIPGINDQYSGGAPDIGATESGAGSDQTPPAAIRDLH